MIEFAKISLEYQYIIIVSTILLVPKLFLRLHIPTGITALAIGCLSINLFGWFKDDQMIVTMARLGITSLFVFAGMEIKLTDLKNNLKPLAGYLIKSLALIISTAIIIYYVLGLSFQVSLILAIAIFTPSAGFILSSLKSYELSDEEIFWIKLKAISKEVAAILTLFIALQLDDIPALFKTLGIFSVLAFSLPHIFKLYLKFIAPYAPKTEVSFLVIMAFVTGVLTKKLGTHYLVGAFATGIVAGQFNHFINSEHSDRIEASLSAFYNIFVPFYFFSAGLILTNEFFTIKGLMYGLLITLIFIPLRLVTVILSIKFFIKDFWDDRFKIAVSLTPTLIFGLVIVGILKERFNTNPNILSAIILYTLVASILPALFFEKMPPEDYDLSKI